MPLIQSFLIPQNGMLLNIKPELHGQRLLRAVIGRFPLPEWLRQ